MRVLLTGCAGFIGSCVCRTLIDAGHQVVGIDNLNDAYDSRLKNWRLSQLPEGDAFAFHRADIAERERIDQILRGHPVDAVINLAARAGVRQSTSDPSAYFETNVMGTLNLLELCRKHDIRKFVLSSTSSVYAGCDQPFREDVATDRPLSPYAASKKAAEGLCFSYHYLFGIDVTVLRYFTVYGPAGRPEMSIYRFIRWIAEENPLILYGNGRQERDFTYVHDVARGTLLALKPLGYEVINLGSDRPVSIQRVIALLEQMLGREARVECRPAHPADIPSTWADIRKARSILGWEPRTSLEEGLQAAVQWYRDNRAWASQIRLGE
jgi:UDP-glucuronate 4-epimerase